jgi:ubiquinone/menaquinone biosynthesis C-methylase UbiE
MKDIKPKYERVKEHFESIASHYNEELPEAFQIYLLRRKMGFIQKYCNDLDSKIALDVGCGQGKYVQYLTHKVKNVVGIDFSFKNIKNTLNLKYNKNALNSDGKYIPFKSNIFDICYCINVIHHLTSREAQKKVIDEMFRVVKPGGYVFIFDLSLKNPFFTFYLKKIFPKIRNIDEGDELFFDTEDLFNLINADYKVITVDFYSFTPDIIPKFFLKFFMIFEKWIEKTFIKRFAMHQVIILKKNKK